MYKPNPVDLTDIELPKDISDLTELIAKNVHEVWAFNRIQEGWKYDIEHNREKKTTPCLCEYEDLPETEKDYDRNTAMETLKLIIKLGYSIRKE